MIKLIIIALIVNQINTQHNVIVNVDVKGRNLTNQLDGMLTD